MDIRMEILDLPRYTMLREGAEVLEADRSGDKVLRLGDGTVFKLFRRKRLLTSAALYPYAVRFADNCALLAKRGIPCPQVLSVYRIKPLASHAVHYEPLPGITLREALKKSANPEALRKQLGHFLATLHDKGIYFRSAHLGNIILTPDNQLGLIDCADLRAYKRPLRRDLRVRNFKHVLRLEQDRALLLDGGTGFLDAYLQDQQASTAVKLASAIAIPA